MGGVINYSWLAPKPVIHRPPRRRIAAAAATIGLCLVTGCGVLLPDREPSPEPEVTASPSPGSEAPEVTHPLDIGDLESEPCDALTEEDLDRLGVVREGEQGESAAGEECAWNYLDILDGVLRFAVWARDADGLPGIYANRDYVAYFEPTEVDGYPGVYADAVQEDPARAGRCNLYLGVNERNVLLLTVMLDRGPDKHRPCEIADEFARLALAHLS